MPRLSHLEAERGLQRYVLAFLGWFILAVLVVGAGGLVVEAGSEPGEGPGDWIWLRAAMGVVASLLSLRLPLLVRRNSDSISHVFGLKGQYLTAAVVTAVLPVPGSAFYWWAGLPAALVGLVSVVLVARIQKVPADEMTESIDYRNPEAWSGRSFLGERFVFLKAVALGLLLGVVLLVAVLLLAT